MVAWALYWDLTMVAIFIHDFVHFIDIKSGHGVVGVSSILSGSYEHGTTIVTTEHMSSYEDGNSGLSPRGLVNGSLNGSVHGSEGSLSGLRPPYSASSLIEERLDSISDNMSYMSLEVNTTGTGSVRVS